MSTILRLLTIVLLFVSAGPSLRAASTVEFAETNSVMTEDDFVSYFKVRWNPPGTGYAQVTVTHTGGSAVRDQDWRFFPPDRIGASRVIRNDESFGLYAVDDGIPEADETIEFTLSKPNGGYVLGANTKTVITIHNRAASIAFDAQDPIVEHGGPFGTIYRLGDTNMAISVDYVLSGGTARAGMDYTRQSGTINFAPGERQKDSALPNPTIDNGTVDGPRTILVTFTNATAGVAFDPSPVEVPIADNEIANSFDRTFSDFDGRLRLLLVQADGKLVVGVYDPLDNGLGGAVRLLPDGSLERSIHPTFDFSGSCVAQQADGKLLITANQGISRLNVDGSIDPSFALDGILAARGYQVSPPILGLPGGGVVVTIRDSLHLLSANGLVRLKANGRLDTNFEPINPDSMRTFSLTSLQADGRILVVGSPSSVLGRAVSVERFYPDGWVDSSFSPPVFGPTGQESFLVVDELIVQSDQKILVSGRFDSVNGVGRTNLVRLLPDGSVDESFTPPAVRADTPLLVQKDGDLLVMPPDPEAFPQPVVSLMRLKADGSLDRYLPMGVRGRLDTLHFQPDGRLLVTGFFRSEERSIEVGSGGPIRHLRSGIARFNLADTDKPGVEFAAELLCVPGGDPECNAYRIESLESDSTPARPRLRRLGNTTNPLTVTLATGGMATPGKDYVSTDSSVAFAAFEVEKSLTVRILDDSDAESDEDIALALMDSTATPTPGSSFSIRILDDEPSRLFTSGPTLLRWFHQSVTTVLNFNAPVSESWHVEASTDFETWSRTGLDGSSIRGAVRRRWQHREIGTNQARFYRAVKE